MTDHKPRPVSVDELPDDPLAMPPPHWRCSGAIFQILAALEALSPHLSKLVPLHTRTERKIDRYFAKYPKGTEESEGSLDEFSHICDHLWGLEHKIRMESERAILMCAIFAEDTLNEFCVFNLHRDISETIEKLSLPEKLLIAGGALSKHGVKSTSVYEAAKKLTSWRNAFAHGHCVDRPIKSLRHNHLISPDEYPGAPGAAADAITFVGYFLAISNHLKSISVNPATKHDSYEEERIADLVSQIQRYSFKGDQQVYSVRRLAKSDRKAGSKRKDKKS